MNGPVPEKQPGIGPSSRRWLIALAVCLVLTVAGALVFADTVMRDTEQVQRFEQPADVRYADGSTHYIGLIEVRSALFHRQRPYQIYAGRYPHMGYGHFVDVPSDHRLVISVVDWQTDGVRVHFDSAPAVFIPAENFTFGR
ncbi:hypothetical protein SAMN04244553_0222 [Nocardia amikacinitolerans]|uniref:Uncharacterized protein n=1 Tax=Nocardia amikacinitolerans TaxID=756689 RepID=A0A285KNW0_9NOCA|nr:hypothetical protein [Nocardia amikacinitolerans]SNY74300.1 hypothetical protein SAMN04244553_0222 [Nocardia amikacinitolerans]